MLINSPLPLSPSFKKEKKKKKEVFKEFNILVLLLITLVI